MKNFMTPARRENEDWGLYKQRRADANNYRKAVRKGVKPTRFVQSGIGIWPMGKKNGNA